VPSNPPAQEPDPIVSQSMSGLLLIASLLLLGSLTWGLYDELYGLRPWKSYQKQFVRAYRVFLKKAIPEAATAEKAVRESPEFEKLDQELHGAEQQVAAQIKSIDDQIRFLDRRLAPLTDAFAAARGELGALTYSLETTSSTRGKEKLRREIEEARERPFRVKLPVPDGRSETLAFTYERLEEEYNRLKEEKGQLLAERVKLLEPITKLRTERQAFLEEKLSGLNQQQLQGLLRKLDNFVIEIKQINVADIQLVDRCESCHLGIREPLRLTAADMGGDKVFASHPQKELLRLHDPELFGCSPCHGGNGRATSGVAKAHGRYKHWLWPLYYSENVEAGCQQCHAREMVLDYAPVLNEGKRLFRDRGCVGCHRFEGFDDEAERLQATQQEIVKLNLLKADYERDASASIQAGDRAETNEEARRLYSRAEDLRVQSSQLDATLEQLQNRTRNLLREVKKVGPNLKEVRLKLRPEWIPVWLENPHAFRPTTRMPRFRLLPDEVKSISAFIWQDGIRAQVSSQPRGNATNGKELFETRGCLGCHAVGEGDSEIGGRFAANLSRLGEKAHYDYIVRWIHDPRERARPYCPLEKRDLGPEDYARHGLPFVFNPDRDTCPNDGSQLLVQQLTVMPSLRLTWEEARDIATYLMTLKRPGVNYAPAPYLNDPELKAQGRNLVRHYGCAGCHEIAGFEDQGRIGTELTAEGSKPIERLDFALLTHEAKREGWYNHKGFFEHKLDDPAFFDQGKEKAPLERLRMPEPNLDKAGITALTTFLLGSTEPQFPPQYVIRPSGPAKDIQDGWWIISKYNCMGCHVIQIGQKSALLTNVPRYQDPDWKDQLPPSLIGEGARVNPEWLATFLANPAMSTTDTNRNGVRTYLRARMPTFSFSPDEIRKLVRFFEALSAQAQPYLPPQLVPLSEAERRMARQLFTHPAAPCLVCHATGQAAHDQTATAPNFLLARERLKPAWTERWIIDPARLAPGTAMPSGLFRREGERWVFSGPWPESLRGYRGDHAELLVRYMFQFTPEEQRLLIGRGGLRESSPAGGAAIRQTVVQSPPSSQ
jgi:cytochrome c551/c552